MPLEFVRWLLQMEASANASPFIKAESHRQGFDEWFATNGGYLHPQIELKSDPATGNTLRVKNGDSIPSSSTLVSCPHHLSLSWPNAYKFHFPDTQPPQCSPHVASRFFLIKQRLLGVASPWWPYICLLPLSFNTPLYYDSADTAWIRGTNLERAKEVKEDAWRREYNEALETFFQGAIDQEQEQLWTWDLYLWASTIMTSRSFPGPAAFNAAESQFPAHDDTGEGREPVLIPGLDLLNHNPSTRVAWVWDSTACTIKTDEPLKGGSEVPNNYGPKSNEELIMGYGFSLPNNPADHFGISFSPAIVAHIKATRNRRLDAEADFPSHDIRDPKQHKGAEASIHWVLLREDRPEFSPSFLEDVSIAVENPRERRKEDKLSPRNIEFMSSKHSRNLVHVLCAVTMVLQKGQTAIRRYDADLPERPETPKQVDAARYRRGQLHILRRALATLYGYLGSMLSKEPRHPGDFWIIRLEDVLSESPRELQKDFRTVLNAGLRTRDPNKIRRRGGADFAFTVWLCGLWMDSQRESLIYEQGSDSTSTFVGSCMQWLRSLREQYSEKETGNLASGAFLSDDFQSDEGVWFDPVRHSSISGNNIADTTTVMASYLNAIQTSTEKHPQSLYNDSNVVTERLAWCYKVIRNEGVWVPSLQDREGDDEWMLVMEY